MPATPAADAPLAKSRDAIYWKGQADKAIKERDEIKKSLSAADGPAAAWRAEAKKALGQLANANDRVGEMRKEIQALRERAIRASEDLDAARRAALAVKERLWTVWSDLADDDPLKPRLWDIWTAL